MREDQDHLLWRLQGHILQLLCIPGVARAQARCVGWVLRAPGESRPRMPPRCTFAPTDRPTDPTAPAPALAHALQLRFAGMACMSACAARTLSCCLPWKT